MGFGFQGLKNAGSSIVNIIAGLIGQDIVAKSFSASQASGSDAFKAAVTGARWHVGPGTTDYLISNGTDTISAAGRLSASDIGPSSNCGINFVPNNMVITATGALTLGGSPVNATLGYRNNTVMMVSATAPTIVAGAGAAIVASNGSAAFSINLGGAAGTGTITLPSATTGWVCYMQDITTPDATVIQQTGGTQTTVTFKSYSRVTGVAANWSANDIMFCLALAF